MKDQPPERNRREDTLHRRIAKNLVLLILGTFYAVYLIGDQTFYEVNLSQAQPIGEPVGGGYIVLLAILGVILLNAAFVAAETALDLLRPMHVKHVKENSTKQSDILQDLIDNKTKYIAASTLGSQTARVTLILLGLVLAQGLAAVMRDNFSLPDHFGSILLAALIISIPLVFVNIIVGELVPKSYASLHPHRVALALKSFVKGAAFVFMIPASLLTGVAGLVTARFGGRASFAIANLAEEEIKTLAESAQETGEIEVDEKELLHSVFEFSDTVAREVMTPRVDIDAMPVNSDPQEVIKLIQESGHSRIPLYEDSDDQIVGIVHAKDLLTAMLKQNGSVNLRSLMRTALFVPENKNLHELLAEMRASRSQLAVVQDEFGGTAGIVTIEDIVEELVGDIVDEYDVEEPEIIQIPDGLLAGGKAHVDDINDMLGSEFESEEFDTIGGYVFGLFGRQPKPEETMSSDGYLFTVEETDGRRIQRLKIQKLPSEARIEVGDTSD